MQYILLHAGISIHGTSAHNENDIRFRRVHRPESPQKCKDFVLRRLQALWYQLTDEFTVWRIYEPNMEWPEVHERPVELVASHSDQGRVLPSVGCAELEEGRQFDVTILVENELSAPFDRDVAV